MGWNQNWTVASVQIPWELNDALKARAARDYIQRSDVIRNAILSYMGIASLGDFVEAERAKKNTVVDCKGAA